MQIQCAWDGTPLDHEPYTFHMEWKFARQRNKAHKRAVKVRPHRPRPSRCRPSHGVPSFQVYLHGPLMDEPEPPESLGGYCADLEDYEVPPVPVLVRAESAWVLPVQAFVLMFANEHGNYLEACVGPHGHWCVRLHKEANTAFNKGPSLCRLLSLVLMPSEGPMAGEELDMEVENTFEGSNWRSVFEVPLAYFPPNVTKWNAFKVHGYPDGRSHSPIPPLTGASHRTGD